MTTSDGTILIPTDIAIFVSPDGSVAAWESYGSQIRITRLE